MLDIRIDMSSLNDLVSRYENRSPAAVEAGLDATANLALRAKKREIDKTYRRPIPRSATGKPKWTRKGTNGGWAGEQSIEKRQGERTITTTGEPAKYEGRLARLPTGADGVNRSNPAADRAAQITEPQALAVFEDAFRRELGL
jgi:hypothetical protein